MFEKEIKELFELSLRAQQETKAFVGFSTGMGIPCSISIIDNGYEKDRERDGDYMLWTNEVLKEESMENYRAAKAHLERLLREKKKGSSHG